MENSKKVKVTNRHLIEYNGLIAQVAQKQLPPKVSFTLARNTEHTDAIVKTFFKEKEKIVDQYVEKGSDGKPKLTENGLDFIYKSDKEKAAFKKALDELMDYENDVEVRKIKLDDLKDSDGKPISFSAAEFRAIDFMLDGE